MTDANSVFCSAEKTDKKILNKARKSFYEKDKVFYKFYARIKDENILDDDKFKVPFYTPFLEQKGDIHRSSALYSIKKTLRISSRRCCKYLGFFFKLCSQSKLLFTMC